MLFTAITITGVEVNPGIKIRNMVGPKVPLEVASIVGKATTKVVVQHLVECSKCGKKNHFKAVCKSGSNDG